MRHNLRVCAALLMTVSPATGCSDNGPNLTPITATEAAQLTAAVNASLLHDVAIQLDSAIARSPESGSITIVRHGDNTHTAIDTSQGPRQSHVMRAIGLAIDIDAAGGNGRLVARQAGVLAWHSTGGGVDTLLLILTDGDSLGYYVFAGAFSHSSTTVMSVPATSAGTYGGSAGGFTLTQFTFGTPVNINAFSLVRSFAAGRIAGSALFRIVNAPGIQNWIHFQIEESLPATHLVLRGTIP